jgi:tyrosyl-tRNA synthetase
MLSFDSVKLRLEREQNLSFLEFNYMLLQAYDFVELHRTQQCRVQIGGSDQWGNIINGVELNRRLGLKEIFGLTTPLITTASGAKMGKTASGAVWLSDDLLSPYDYWQFWRNTEDADVGKFLRLFTELPPEEIARLEQLEGNAINDAKKVLAFEATKLCHGEQAALAAAETARQTFEEKGAGAGLPVIEIAKTALTEGIQAYQLLQQSGLASSGGEARRLIRGGGARINDVAFASETQMVSVADINTEGMIKLSAGKKHHALIKIA